MSPSCEITWCTCGCKWLMVMFILDGLLCHVMINYVNWWTHGIGGIMNDDDVFVEFISVRLGLWW